MEGTRAHRIVFRNLFRCDVQIAGRGHVDRVLASADFHSIVFELHESLLPLRASEPGFWFATPINSYSYILASIPNLASRRLFEVARSMIAVEVGCRVRSICSSSSSGEATRLRALNSRRHRGSCISKAPSDASGRGRAVDVQVDREPPHSIRGLM